jgi:hypothetical protein
MRTACVLIFLALIFSQSSHANSTLSPALHLRKIKFRLTGQDPSSAEYYAIQKREKECAGQSAACMNDYLRAKVQEYMGQPQFIGKGVELVNSLMYFAPFSKPYEAVSEKSVERYRISDSLTLLSKRIFTENRKWTELFTANEYELTSTENTFVISDVLFFSSFIPDELKPVEKGSRLRVSLPEDIAAGFITTPRMNLRFFNTPVNEGRKRAAAVLRIGFCDDMFPAIERGEEHRLVEDQIARGKKFEEVIEGMKQANLHGQRKDCAQCHVYRSLDHLAWTFRGFELGLDPKPAPGRFTYLMPDGKVVDQPVRGIGHYARVLTEQEIFVPCQVKNLWTEFGGSSVTLERNKDLQDRLAAEYRREGSGIKDFLSFMVLQPEFRKVGRDLIVDPKFAAAEKVMINCNNCHGGRRPSFTKLPIMVNGVDRTQVWIERIISSLDIQPYSKNADYAEPMPPFDGPWQPSTSDLQAVREWIEAGVPDAEGKKHISLEWLESLAR